MTTQYPPIPPEQWPPNNWPACPDPARYKDAVKRVQEKLERSQGVEDLGGYLRWVKIMADPPKKVRGRSEDDDQFILSEIITSRMSYEHGMRIVKNQEPQDNADEFLFASTLTSHRSIGAVFLTEGSTSTRIRSAFGVMHRDPDWAGLCLGLAEVKGLEAMIFCNAEHQPDVIMAAPRNHLGQDPSKSPKCSESGNIDQQGINQTLADVFQHHGATPHFIDLCGRHSDPATIIANLLATPDE